MDARHRHEIIGDLVNANKRIYDLEKVIEEVHSWAVCGCITTADDMMQNIPRIVEITTPNEEYRRIATEAGYCVVRSDLGGYYYETPEADASEDFTTEDLAWKACCLENNLLTQATESKSTPLRP